MSSEKLEAITEQKQAAGKSAPAAGSPPYPPSPVITGIEWAPKETIVRKAPGGDNWPMTWADDGHLYTAYGDGYGFEPLVPEKLGMGLARVEGGPVGFEGFNIRAATLENRGQGAAGRKASGIVMVDGVLYLFVRNAGNSQVGWSKDHGKTWTWSDWKFTTSFGCPTVLNFGKNYDGARDAYVYVYSQDHDSAYERADRMVLARVPKDRIADRQAYEFFVRLDAGGEPVWTNRIDQRGAVFSNPGECYRSGITYNAGLKRYLWCQVDPDSTHRQGMRFEGGFRIFDAPEPWGPWTSVFATEHWDVGPGETNSFPTKWMSEDGRTLYLVFSGDDHFSVRKATLKTAGSQTDEATAVCNPRAGGLLTGKHGPETILPGTRFDGNQVYRDRYWHNVCFASTRVSVCHTSAGQVVAVIRNPGGRYGGTPAGTCTPLRARDRRHAGRREGLRCARPRGGKPDVRGRPARLSSRPGADSRSGDGHGADSDPALPARSPSPGRRHRPVRIDVGLGEAKHRTSRP